MKSVKGMARIAAGAGLALLLAAGGVLAASTATAGIEDHLGRIERILTDVDKAKEILTGKSSTSDAARAKDVLSQRQADLERARIDVLSASSGMSRDKIAAMRDAGRGWGDIARDLGINVDILGVGPDGKDLTGKGYAKVANKGKKKGWKKGMPPGQAKKLGYDD